MELFHRHSDENDNLDHFEAPEALEADIPTDATPEVVPEPPLIIDPTEIKDEDYDEESRDWRRISLQVLAGLIVLLIIVFGGRWLHHELTHKSTPKPTATNIKRPQTAPTTPSAPANGSATSNAGNSSSANTTPSTSLPNTGPGDDLAIFVVAALAAASLHYANSLRKQRR